MGSSQTVNGQKRILSDSEVLERQMLFKNYITPYYRMIYKLCKQYSDKQDDVEDNFVGALTNIYKYIKTYNTDKPLITWIHIVTKRYVHNVDNQRQKHINMWNRDNDVDTFSNEDGLSNEEEKQEMSMDNYEELYNDNILWALHKLKTPYRRALLLQQAGFKLKEIAHIEYQTGFLDSNNVETVKSRLFLARQQLKQLLTRDGERRTDTENN